MSAGYGHTALYVTLYTYRQHRYIHQYYTQKFKAFSLRPVSFHLLWSIINILRLHISVGLTIICPDVAASRSSRSLHHVTTFVHFAFLLALTTSVDIHLTEEKA